jgi:hypothetical protein
MHKGTAALLWGEPRCVRGGGNPPAPAFPLVKPERGTRLLAAAGLAVADNRRLHGVPRLTMFDAEVLHPPAFAGLRHVTLCSALWCVRCARWLVAFPQLDEPITKAGLQRAIESRLDADCASRAIPAAGLGAESAAPVRPRHRVIVPHLTRLHVAQNAFQTQRLADGTVRVALAVRLVDAAGSPVYGYV